METQQRKVAVALVCARVVCGDATNAKVLSYCQLKRDSRHIARPKLALQTQPKRELNSIGMKL